MNVWAIKQLIYLMLFLALRAIHSRSITANISAFSTISPTCINYYVIHGYPTVHLFGRHATCFATKCPNCRMLETKLTIVLCIRPVPRYNDCMLWLCAVDGPKYCNRTWDDIMCWPDVAAGQTFSQPCPSYISNFHVDGIIIFYNFGFQWLGVA